MRYRKLVFIGATAAFSATAIAIPEGWTITEFASPPEAEYPTAVSAAANGDVYISSDRNGSLDRNPEYGKIVRATDTDGDGKADDFQDFVPHVTSPRGGHYVGNTFYLIHPPYLSSYRDTNGDGVADENKVLVKGFGWGVEHSRGADHTTNGVRMGIDGWLYVAVGDYGMPDAVAADGSRFTLWGGGVVRVRPDGSEMEPYAVNVRNICDIAITPTMDLFSRDNTNDGKGWNTRFHHYVPMGDHGYPRLYQNFAEEIVTPLADFGGGSGTGALSLNEPGFPEKFSDGIFTCDWTTGNVYLHPMQKEEATFRIDQEVFHQLSRAIDIDVDGSSRLYVADWRNGRFRYEPELEIGMVQQILPPDWKERKFPDLKAMDDSSLADQIGSDSAVLRLEAQREMILRGKKDVFGSKLIALATDSSAHLFNRVAAIFTYKQVFGSDSSKELVSMADDSVIREFALRALADRKSELENVPAEIFVKYLNDENPRVRVQVLNGLARLGAKETAPAIIASMANADLDPGTIGEPERRIVPHVAIKALAKLGADEACLAAVEESSTRGIALRALQEMHTDTAVDGLIDLLNNSSDQEVQLGALETLSRLFYKEDEWDLKEWWTTRPDDRGPYFRPVEWAATERIRAAIEDGFSKVPEEKRNAFISHLAKNRISVTSLDIKGLDPLMLALSESEPSEANIHLLSDAAMDSERDWEQRLLAYQAVGKAPSEKSVPAQIKILAKWVDEGRQEAESPLTDFVNDTRRGLELKIIDEVAKKGNDTESMIAWKVMLTINKSPLAKANFKEHVEKILAKNPMEIGLFLAIADMKLSGYEQQIDAALNSDNSKTIQAAERAKAAGVSTGGNEQKVGAMKPEEVTKYAMENKGDVKNGERLFVSQGCIACHAIDLKAVQKGPFLGSAGAKFERKYLIESILDPNAVVAQGFQTEIFTLNDGTSVMGFVTKEEDDLVEVRDIAGQVTQVKRSEVKDEKHLPQSMMPPGLGAPLGIKEFTDLIEYLNSLKEIGG
ncbi:heme-binding domain-containing protein [Luteolibacter algae]|uniref:Heme-binding domain-containing protein n=1 Tax=Luteolibacter algae TaxID=454151 RepID=A0ABW5DAA8_9BACT